MKTSIKNLAVISLSMLSLLSLSLGQNYSLKAQSLDDNITDNSTIPYPMNDPDVRQYRQDCINRNIDAGFQPSTANEICDCSLNTLYKYYTYHNSQITLEHFKHLVHDVHSQNPMAINIMNDAESECL